MGNCHENLIQGTVLLTLISTTPEPVLVTSGVSVPLNPKPQACSRVPTLRILRNES